MAALTVVEGAPRLGWFELSPALLLALAVAKLFAMGALLLTLLRDLKVPTKVLVAVGVVSVAAGTALVLLKPSEPSFVLAPAPAGLGEAVFLEYCAGCHGELGQGGTGPDLTDGTQTHPDSAVVIAEGVKGTGMVGWGAILPQDELSAVTAYVLGLAAQTPSSGQPAQTGSDR